MINTIFSPWRNASIFVKLVIATIFTVVMTSLVITVITLTVVTDQLDDDLNTQADVILSSLAQSSRESLLELQINELNSLAAASSQSTDVTGVYIYNADNQKLVDTSLDDYRLNFETDPLSQAVFNSSDDIYRDQNDDRLLVGQVIEVAGQPLGVVVVELSTDSLQENTRNIQRTSFVVTLAVIGLVTLITLVFARQFTAPLRKLTTGAEAFSQQNFKTKIDISGNDEFAVLGQSFNQMASELQNLFTDLERRVNQRTLDIATAAIISRQVATLLNPDDLLQLVVQEIVDKFRYEIALIFLADKKGETLVPAAIHSAGATLDKSKISSISLSDNTTLIAHAAQARLASRNYELSSDQRLRSSGLLELLDTKSELVIPMTVGENLIGVLDIHSKDATLFTSEDELVLTIIAEQIAIAVRNAQLIQETEAARNEAEKANNVKSQFLASVSHELRTPLNGILNFTAFVADEMLGPVNEEQVNVLRDVITNGEHLLALINDVLDISKIEAGSLKLFIEDDVDINEEIQTAIKTGEALVAEKPVKLVTEMADNLPQLRGDKRRIRQIILNLVSNACKFTNEGQVTVSAQKQDNAVLIEVKDTGPGIAAEELELIFETFTQTETGLQQGAGTGLGLPISRRLAEAHGGKLWVESTVGEGAQFFVVLPIDHEFENV